MPTKARAKATAAPSRTATPRDTLPARRKATATTRQRSPSAPRGVERVSSGTTRLASDSSRRRSLVTRQNGTERRRTTVYFEPELARRLNVYCATHDLEMSQVVGEAVEALLRKKGG